VRGPAGPQGGTGAPAGRPHAAPALDAAAWGGRPVSRVEELLAGYVAGVAVTPTPGGYIVRVRGAASLAGDAEPLYVVDGLPLVPQGTRTLDGLNPADVRRVEVLKDAADLTFFGVRGAHGVIRITTKRARAR
jgi:TonB-dependent SusC/RagA subfamily outer membrane receptor